MTTPLVVSGWSAVSALGFDAQDFSTGIVSGRSGLTDAASSDLEVPTGRIGPVPGFEIRAALGRKNTRSMDRATGLAVLTVGRLLEQQRANGHEPERHDVGLVLGTTTGSVQSMMDFTKDSLTQDKPYLVDPARFPNTVMNCAAGQCAIWHDLRGPNTTIAGGQVTGLNALNYATRLHRCGHSTTILCGAVEELSRHRAWLEAQAREDDGTTPLGEGCAVFQLESAEDAAAAGRPVFAELLAVRVQVYGGAAESPQALGNCVAAALKAADRSAEEVWSVAADLTADQDTTLTEVVGRARRIRPAQALGDTGAASAALQLAAVLSHAESDPDARGRLALIASVDRDGLVGAAVLRIPDVAAGRA